MPRCAQWPARKHHATPIEDNFMKNTRALMMIAVAFTLAVLAVVVAASWINGQAKHSGNKVAVALTDISLGARVSPEMVNMVDWPSNAVPPGAFSDAKLLETRIARSNILRGEPIMESKLAPPGTTGGLSSVVADGKRAMTVRVNDVAGVAGFALPGNFVDILVNTQDDGTKSRTGQDQAISKIVLERILVLAIAQESNRDETKPKVVNAVTLELTPEQVEKLDLARSVGTLSLVLRNQIDPGPVNTGGATKTSLLELRPPAPQATTEAKATRRLQARRSAPAHARPPGANVELINGLDRSHQQFK
jgi:pilus assembly protein CpaB